MLLANFYQTIRCQIPEWSLHSHRHKNLSSCIEACSSWTSRLRHLFGKIVALVFGILPEVDKKISIFWDITPFSPLKVNRRFLAAYRLQHSAVNIALLPAGVMLVSCMDFWNSKDRRNMFIRNVVWLSEDYTTFYQRIYNSVNRKAKISL
jgi:hypothetical protein